MSPGIYVDVSLTDTSHPNTAADQIHPLMAAALLDGSAPPLRNDPRNMGKSSRCQPGLQIPQISIHLSFHWIQSEPRTIHGGPNMDGSWFWRIQQMLNWIGIWRMRRPV